MLFKTLIILAVLGIALGVANGIIHYATGQSIGAFSSRIWEYIDIALTRDSDRATTAEAQIPQDLTNQWVVTPQQAKRLIEQGATVLDVRNAMLRTLGHLPGSTPVSWQDFSQPQGISHGKLLEQENILTHKLQKVGVFNDKPVVVIGDPLQGWGEDGRIVWMLRTLGHKGAVLVDGGYTALVNAGVSTRSLVNPNGKPGDFVVKRISQWDIERDQFQAKLNNPNLIIIDTREAREYAGKTPYGEQRGGHVPGAIHVHFQELLDKTGKLLPDEQLTAKLEARGITTEAEIVTYCTGGIRSGWLTAILVDLGFDTVKNYAGSMWEWSAAPADSYPLEK